MLVGKRRNRAETSYAACPWKTGVNSCLVKLQLEYCVQFWTPNMRWMIIKWRESSRELLKWSGALRQEVAVERIELFNPV